MLSIIFLAFYLYLTPSFDIYVKRKQDIYFDTSCCGLYRTKQRQLDSAMGKSESIDLDQFYNVTLHLFILYVHGGRRRCILYTGWRGRSIVNTGGRVRSIVNTGGRVRSILRSNRFSLLPLNLKTRIYIVIGLIHIII